MAVVYKNSVKTVKSTARAQAKRGSGVVTRTKITAQKKRMSALTMLICVILQLFIAAVCLIALSLPSLWFETLLRPSFAPHYLLFLVIFTVPMLIMAYVPYKTFTSKNNAAYVALITNYTLLLMTFYVFFVFRSLLGGFVLIVVLIAQTATMLPGQVKKNRFYGCAVGVYIAMQCYFAALLYTFLMLN